METKDEFTTREPEQAQVGSRGPRLVINEMVMRNFKSYASEQRVGPFHKVRAVRCDNGEKTDISRVFLVEQVKGMLDKIQQNLFDVAKQKRDACIEVVKTRDEFVKPEVEKDVKARTRGEMGAAKSLCTPFEQPELSEARVSKQHKLFS
ncbi:hypothetical protein V6Z12_D05G395400 [Gossypium hirsutum]